MTPTKDEAIAWAVKMLAESFAYDYYRNESKAKQVAAYMTALTGEEWSTFNLKGYDHIKWPDLPRTIFWRA